MVIEVRLYAVLRKYSVQSPNGMINMEVPEATSVQELIEMLDINIDEVKLVMVNGKNTDLDTILSDGDRIGLFPPVGGG
jgi:sulfur carrier protein ThiS